MALSVSLTMSLSNFEEVHTRLGKMQIKEDTGEE